MKYLKFLFKGTYSKIQALQTNLGSKWLNKPMVAYCNRMMLCGPPYGPAVRWDGRVQWPGEGVPRPRINDHLLACRQPRVFHPGLWWGTGVWRQTQEGEGLDQVLTAIDLFLPSAPELFDSNTLNNHGVSVSVSQTLQTWCKYTAYIYMANW